MIFRPVLVSAIARGVKTQTRRPVKGDDPCRYKAGRSYAVQPGRGRPATLRIVVTDVRLEAVGEVTFDDARAEGFRTTDEFKAYWVRLHDGKWVEKVDDPSEGELAERFDIRHARKPVWVLAFQVDREDTPRLLAARPGSAKADYVSNPAQALQGEPEAVSGIDLERLARKGALTARQWQALEASGADLDAHRRSVDDRVQSARRKAQAVGVDVSREVHKVRAVQAAGRPQEVVERWVQALERKAFTTTIGRAA